MTTPREIVLVFVRDPAPGRVKTRLASGVGDERAAEIYRRLAERTLHVVRASCGERRGVRLVVDPPGKTGDAARWLGPGLAARPQAQGDLGERMSAAFTEAFADGAERVVVVGTDCPGLLAEDIDAAFDALTSHDAVLGPATDGGYWLLGLAAERPSVFRGIVWSAPDVLERTLEILRSENARFVTLRTQGDVDTPDDLRALAPELEASPGPALPHPGERP